MARRVVINGRFLGQSVTGVQRYAREILWQIDRLASEGSEAVGDLQFVVAVPRTVESSSVHLERICLEQVGRLDGYAWEQIELAYFARNDLLVNLCNLKPILHHRSITCVHDAHIWLMPNNFSKRFEVIYKTLLPLAIRTSRRWTTVSRYSEEQLRLFRVSGNCADSITYNGSDHARAWNAGKARLSSESLPDRYVFALGSTSSNKNLQLVARLAKPLAERGVSIVVAGGGNRTVFGAGADRVEGEWRHLGRVSDDDLALLYSNALCFIFPSKFEGFGLPPVEAMTWNCPVVASNTSAMPEVLGDAAILCAPDAPADWLEAITSLAEKPDLRSRYVEAGRKRAEMFLWRDTALKFLDLIQAESPP